jgi:hypothetical protein
MMTSFVRLVTAGSFALWFSVPLHAQSPLTPAIASAYYALKDALVRADSSGAAKAGAVLLGSLRQLPKASIPAAAFPATVRLQAQAQHLSSDPPKLAAQRTRFLQVSKDAELLFRALPSGRPVYVQFCPMAFGGAGGAWLSDKKEILNPYFGDQMLHCGSVRAKLE